MEPSIDAAEFTDILQELLRQPLPINRYRRKVGLGRSNTFGIVSRRCLSPDYSRLCWNRPLLYKHLLDFGQKFCPFPFTSITVNESFRAGLHYDKGNDGNSLLVGFGDYTNGELQIVGGDLSGNYNIQHRPLICDFTTNLHQVLPFEGQRYSLVFYNIRRPVLGGILPVPSVKKDDNKWFFYRGDEKITRKTGLPHPLRRPKIVSSSGVPVVVSFK